LSPLRAQLDRPVPDAVVERRCDGHEPAGVRAFDALSCAPSIPRSTSRSCGGLPVPVPAGLAVRLFGEAATNVRGGTRPLRGRCAQGGCRA